MRDGFDYKWGRHVKAYLDAKLWKTLLDRRTWSALIFKEVRGGWWIRIFIWCDILLSLFFRSSGVKCEEGTQPHLYLNFIFWFIAPLSFHYCFFFQFHLISLLFWILIHVLVKMKKEKPSGIFSGSDCWGLQGEYAKHMPIKDLVGPVTSVGVLPIWISVMVVGTTAPQMMDLCIKKAEVSTF